MSKAQNLIEFNYQVRVRLNSRELDGPCFISTKGQLILDPIRDRNDIEKNSFTYDKWGEATVQIEYDGEIFFIQGNELREQIYCYSCTDNKYIYRLRVFFDVGNILVLKRTKKTIWEKVLNPFYNEKIWEIYPVLADMRTIKFQLSYKKDDQTDELEYTARLVEEYEYFGNTGTGIGIIEELKYDTHSYPLCSKSN
ncbi:hypothetical protein GCM10023331_22150 [Algivirga pacifica]|uniref:DUF4178 domain-containing protein n=1 Tax=Algivirga pacifica TaxID=1162670 RepID=A0ABP9DDX9_9BACT